MKSIVLATEDELSEQLGLRLAVEASVRVHQKLRRGGNGYLGSRISGFCEMASFQTVFIITDLDRLPCPSMLLEAWLGRRLKPRNLLLRVAVREVESWLLADHQAMRQLLGLGAGTIPRDPDGLTDPKATLLSLAKRAPRAVREDLLPANGAIAGQGLGYNSRLSNFVSTKWSPVRASEKSPSLRSALERLRESAV